VSPPRSRPQGAAFPPRVLREYALLADGERGAVVGPEGDLAWLCFPRWDDPAVFSGLIGGRGGYRVRPVGDYVWGGSYEPGSLIWSSRWTIASAPGEPAGVVTCRDALALPATPDSLVLLRRVTAVRGAATVEVRFDLRPMFGRHGLTHLREDTDEGAHTDAAAARAAREDGVGRRADVGAGTQARAVWRGSAQGVHAAWSGPTGMTLDHGVLHRLVDLREDASLDLVLVLDTGAAPEVPSAEDAWADTTSGWQRRVPRLPSTSVARRDAEHAYAVLTGLTSASGAMVAAATLGLPERARAGRNYDYRYAWIRDQCYVGQAAALGAAEDLRLMVDAVRFVGGSLRAHGTDLAPAYTADGRPVPDQTSLDLPGYPGGSDIVGNHVNAQFQLDAFGEALLLFAAADGRGHLDADGWTAVGIAADAIASRWTEDDAGIWELGPAPWAHSRLTAAAGLRAVSRRPAAGTCAGGWAALADTLVAHTSEHCLHPTGRWQRTPEDQRVDAALLLPGLRGAVPADDPRTLATLEAVLAELTEDGHGYRFRHGDTPLGRAEGSFTLVGFLIHLALAQQGRHTEAARWFERTRASCGPPGLLTEEFDVDQRQLRGNLPQAFVHALLLESTLRQDAADHR
jgi:hypothetical protein